MYTPQELHYYLDLRLDRVATQARPDFNAAEKDVLLNDAQLLYIKDHFKGPNFSFDVTEKSSQNLAPLIVRYPIQSYITDFVQSGGIAIVPYSSFTYRPLYFISLRVRVKEPCVGDYHLRFIQHDDLNEALRDPFFKPSNEFLLYNYGSLGDGTPAIFIYCGDLVIERIEATYVRYPRRVSLGTYTHLDGQLYPPQGLEVSEHSQDEVLDIAARIAVMHIADTNASLQTKMLAEQLNSEI